jgi:5'-methylthioadenosine phosphorylase
VNVCVVLHAGGSGVDDPDILADRKEITVTTPFGDPSGPLVTGTIEGVECVLLARHGPRHRIMPSNVNFRANVYALKAAGCSHLLVCTACGSLQEDMKPGELVAITGFIDRTTKRASTFYDGSEASLPGVCHIPMADPFCIESTRLLTESLEELSIPHHLSGTMISIEGPRFSSKAESHMFRQWGANLINMTTSPEVAVANEAGLPYAAIAMVTDYDCWREGEEHVSVDAVMAVMGKNKQQFVDMLKNAIPKFKAYGMEKWAPVLEQAQQKANSSVMCF